MANRDMTFASVQTAGQLLPNDLLQMIARGDTSLPGLKPQDYHLPAGVKLNEAVTQAWNRLLGVWKNFRELMERLPQTETGTTETRERWLLHLFSELGYGRLQSQRPIEIEARSYPISHKAQEPVAFYLVSFRWEIDHRNPMARGETRLSPHSMMQEFLNRSDKHLWGFVSNGLKLRLLRDNLSMVRSAYIEFDLWTMMENELYSDFFLLWLICHQSRLEIRTSDDEDQTSSDSSCRLEHWYQNAVENGVRMMEELREGVQSAIEVIGAGLISHQANQSLKTSLSSQSLNAQDFYTQVLRLVYRLIFIFVAEERDLLKAPHTDETAFTIYQRFYSAARIRALAGRRGGSRHGDLWAQLLLLFQALHHGEPALGLPALGSFLFDPLNTPDLNSCQLSNHDLLEAIRLLCYTRKNRLLQPVSYRNLGSEEMGSVYEALLEMVPEIDPEHGGFRLLVLPGNLRKSTASYYTPSTLVNALVDSALEPVIAERLSKAAPQDQETALLSLKVCDPACGSGHFLVAAAHRLAKRLASIRSHEEEPAPSVIQHALRDVIGHCVYGVDLNPMAVELCKITLWMEAMEPGKPLTFLDHHIQCGNSLLGCTPALLDRGIPDVAFEAMEGDDMSVCAAFKRLNKRGKAQSEIFAFDTDTTFSRSLSSAPVSEFWVYNDDTIQGLEAKSKAYHEYLSSASYRY
ncbi:MAG TPA: N-6 DNA methylase, partial [Candidatus Cloacimonadota bacterium]|nr:N-6 DNA methylase [Candidatus Cloacimonadota bacterium]